MEKIERLAREAFPPMEFVDPEKLIELEKSEGLCFWELYDKDVFIGYMTIVSYSNIAYLYYFAIDSCFRDRGYGKKAIDCIKELYPGTQIVVDEEILDEKAENHQQRLKRRNFYLLNGFKPTGHFFKYLGCDYELLCTSNDFNFEGYKKLSAELETDGYRSEYY